MQILRIALLLLTMLFSIVSPTWPIIDVTDEERTTLEDTARAEDEAGHPRAWRRLQAILMLGSGERVVEVAEKLHCSTKTVYQWIGKWRDGKLDGVRPKSFKVRPLHYKRRTDFDARVAQLLAMREAGMKWSAIAAEMGYKTGSGPMVLLQRAIDMEANE